MIIKLRCNAILIKVIFIGKLNFEFLCTKFFVQIKQFESKSTETRNFLNIFFPPKKQKNTSKVNSSYNFLRIFENYDLLFDIFIFSNFRNANSEIIFCLRICSCFLRIFQNIEIGILTRFSLKNEIMATNSKSSKKEKQLRLKLVKNSLKGIETWPTLISKGKTIIQDILRQEKSKTEFDGNLQNSCENLTEIVDQCQAIVSAIESNHSKLNSLQDLSNLSLDTSAENQSFNLDSSTSDCEIIDCHDIVLKSYQKQLRILTSVAENIAFKESDQAVFLACSWTMQPYLNDDYLTALEYLKSL